jgi:SAM-dependent methyltransferase
MATSSGSCPACGDDRLQEFYRESSIPTNSCLLLPSMHAALEYPRGDLNLALCTTCGFITNTAFDPELSEYSSRYEETQAFSPTFVAFGRELAQRWVNAHGLAGRTVLEIGCGKGEFLTWMVEAGVGRGIGVDPGTHPERIDSPFADRLTWITDFYGEEYSHLQADAVVCRHTLEHIPDVRRFMTTIRRAIGEHARIPVLFELPDTRRVLEEVAFWDIYYEHCSYFTAGSLARLFRETGFEVSTVERDYDDQYLLLEAIPSTTPAGGAPLMLEEDVLELRAAIDSFSDRQSELLDRWVSELVEVSGRGERAVIWGSGSKGVSFLTNLAARGVDVSELVGGAVDINPFKHGMFMAGTGTEILAPERLLDIKPALVIVMNPVYLEEIRQQIGEMGLQPSVVAV